jgi:signal transduction histidine kinase
MSRTLLFLDDDIHLLEAMARTLRKSDCQVLVAENLTQAHHFLQMQPVDAIIVDECMPGISGTSFLCQVADHFPDVIRVLLTGQPSMQVATNAINRGKVNFFFTKPCNTRDLLETLETAFEEKSRTKESLGQVQKMGALGRLTTGIVHDFNNMLNVIGGCGELALKATDDNDPCRESLATICKASDKAAGLTRQLLAFSRQHNSQATTFELNSIFPDMEKMLSCALGHRIQLRFVLAPDLPAIHVNRAQLEQALLNLTINARDAIPQNGTLTVTTSVSLRDGVESSDSASRRFVTVEVKDSGQGMDEATKNRIFEPFFTTKTAGRGTGLGLTMVHDFVTRSSGIVEVESAVGKGTTFRLFIPAVERDKR